MRLSPRRIGPKGNEPTVSHQSPGIRRREDRVHHVRVRLTGFLDGEIVAAATGDGVHARAKV